MTRARLLALLAPLPLLLAAPAPAEGGPADGEDRSESSESSPEDSAALGRGLRLGGLRFAAPSDPRLAPPNLRLSFSVPAHRSPGLQSLLDSGPRHVELSWTESTLKGVHLAASTAAFLGAVSTSYDLWDEKKTWWMVGGAAALGALYGGTKGYDDPCWRASIRFSDD